jgi:glycine/D-amino acid oxidase-like deaminating enzyme
MMTASAFSLIVIGGGITGLSLGLRALDMGFSVRLIAKDKIEASASAMAAGMIAPSMEAISDPDPSLSFERYQQAQSHWASFAENIGLSEVLLMAQPAIWLWSLKAGPDEATMLKRFGDMGAKPKLMSEGALADLGFSPPFAAIEVKGEWLLAAEPVMAFLKELFITRGGLWVENEVTSLTSHSISLKDMTTLEAGHIVVCAGYQSQGFMQMVEALGNLRPIKGHLLERSQKALGVHAGRMIRAPWGYWVFLDGLTKFGATMQKGREDYEIEPTEIEALRAKSHKFTPQMIAPLEEITPRIGIRADTPDHWPLIGRDQGGVLVATGMRRNGWMFAPMAAEIIMAHITGKALPEGAEAYNPQRFKP